MKSYPSITKEITEKHYIYAFDKLDGSNIRAEWNPKKGFYKFGTRTQVIDETSKPFGFVVNLIREKFEKALSEICIAQKWESCIFFFEVLGEDSFAGSHNYDKPFEIYLIDANPYKKGILEPKKFIELFNQVAIPKILFEGIITEEFVESVKDGSLPEMSFEGVVCKGASTSKAKEPVMFKIKSKAWLQKLRNFCKDDEEMFKRLS